MIDRFIIFVCVFLAACTNNWSTETSSHDRRIVHLTEQIWSQSFEDDYKDCVYGVHIVTPSHDNFKLLCGKSSKLSIGCVQSRGTGFLRGKTLYLSPSVHNKGRDVALAHITMHALYQCMAQRYGVYDRNDDLHTHPDIWLDSAGDRSVEYQILQAIK